MSEQNPASPWLDENVSRAPTTGESADSQVAESELPANMASTDRSEYRRGFFFWSLAPFLVLFLIVMAIVTDKDTAKDVVRLCALETAVLSLLMALWNPHRFWWAWRVLGAFVFLAFVAFVAAMAIEGRVGTDRLSEPSLINAVYGLVVFGLPGLWYAIFGRLISPRESIDIGDDAFDEGESP